MKINIKIGLIGCGRVGLTIGYFLKKNNYLFGVYDIDRRAQYRAIRILKIAKNPDFQELIKKCNILLFATPDDEITDAFKKVKKYIADEKYLIHFSGLLPAEIFPGRKNVYRAALHPFATFPRITIHSQKKRYRLFFQGDEQSYRVIRRIFSKKNFIIHKISKEQKSSYHLLGVFSSNLLVALNEAIGSITKELKWTEKQTGEIVLPMLIETLSNIRQYGIENTLSGPLIRGDITTIGKHLKILKRNPDLYNIYCALSRIILKYAPVEKQRILKKILQLN